MGDGKEVLTNFCSRDSSDGDACIDFSWYQKGMTYYFKAGTDAVDTEENVVLELEECKKIASSKVTKLPNKTEYILGVDNTIDSSGIAYELTYTDGTTETFTGDGILSWTDIADDLKKIGEQEVQVLFEDPTQTHYISYQINLISPMDMGYPEFTGEAEIDTSKGDKQCFTFTPEEAGFYSFELAETEEEKYLDSYLDCNGIMESLSTPENSYADNTTGQNYQYYGYNLKANQTYILGWSRRNYGGEVAQKIQLNVQKYDVLKNVTVKTENTFDNNYRNWSDTDMQGMELGLEFINGTSMNVKYGTQLWQ